VKFGVVADVLMIVGGVAAFAVIRHFGEGLTAPEPPRGAISIAAPKAGQVDVVTHGLAALAAVVGLGFVLGRAFRFVGQPPVIGEVIAGILLGPSLLGQVWPEAMHFLIPGPDADPNQQVPSALKVFAQLGVVLYMFLVGLELDASKLKNHAHSTVCVSHPSIMFPFVLGAALALWLYPSL
jgi:Kef-type K+ transport system membrane component KefB